jgi:hypothetical protein
MKTLDSVFIYSTVRNMSLTRVSKFNVGQPTPLQTELRRESARLWVNMVKLHKFIRKRRWKWPLSGDFEKHFKGKYKLHSQTIQALIKTFFANIETTAENRKAGNKNARYPYRDKKRFQVVMYKASAIRRKGSRIILSNGKGVKSLIVRIPNDIPVGKITGAELGFRELRLTIKQDVESINPLGQLLIYLKYKGKFQGVKLEKIGEQYTTQSCPKCGHRHKPSGRNYQCKNPECDFIGVRDLVGAANIKNKFENGSFISNYLLPPLVAKYLRPVKTPVTRSNVVVHLTGGMLLNNTHDTAQALSSADGKTSSELFHAA